MVQPPRAQAHMFAHPLASAKRRVATDAKMQKDLLAFASRSFLIDHSDINVALSCHHPLQQQVRLFPRGLVSDQVRVPRLLMSSSQHTNRDLLRSEPASS